VGLDTMPFEQFLSYCMTTFIVT